MKKNTYTKKDIIDRLSMRNGISKQESSVMLKLVLDEILSVLLKSEKNYRLEIRGFGIFNIKPTKARNNARNPKTNERIRVPERRKISFKPGKILNQKLKKKIK